MYNVYHKHCGWYEWWCLWVWDSGWFGWIELGDEVY
jgi:hypothetical protein